MSTGIINHLQHRVSTLKQNLQGATQRMDQLQLEIRQMNTDLEGYERALAAEMRECGITDTSKDAEQGSFGSFIDGTSDNLKSDGDSVNKAEFARQFIRGRADNGSSPTDLFKGFHDAGIPIKKPYIYALVQRLQKQKAIQLRRNGKWYPLPNPEQSLNGTVEKALS